jgi:maleamate amidohydrolase
LTGESSVNLDRQWLGLGDRPALVVVDMINGFTDPTCPLGGHYSKVIRANQQLLQTFRQQNLPVYFTTVVYHNEQQAKVFRQRLPALNLLTAHSQWVEVNKELARRDNEPIIEKQWASAFHKTDLDQRLRDQGIDSLVVTGLTTSGCVRATAVDGLQYDYYVVVAEEAVGDRNPEAHRANLFDLQAKYVDLADNSEIVSTVSKLQSGL